MCLSVCKCVDSRVTTYLENLEKSGNWIVVREKSGKMEKVWESYNHHLAAEREKDITTFLSIGYLACRLILHKLCIIKINLCIIKCQIVYL